MKSMTIRITCSPPCMHWPAMDGWWKRWFVNYNLAIHYDDRVGGAKINGYILSEHSCKCLKVISRDISIVNRCKV